MGLQKVLENAGKKIGLEIWRVNNFDLEDVPISQYGKFFKGDSYIILNTYQQDNSSQIEWDLHFWIGEQSSQDEYGAAACMVVQLDEANDGVPVQFRETQENESERFLRTPPPLGYTICACT